MGFYNFLFQKNLDDLEHKFRKFQKPADFEPKMAHVKGILENVKEGIGVIELKNGEPEVIQTQLDACMVRALGLYCSAKFRAAPKQKMIFVKSMYWRISRMISVIQTQLDNVCYDTAC